MAAGGARVPSVKRFFAIVALLVSFSSPVRAQEAETASASDVLVENERQPGFGAMGLKGHLECRRNAGVVGGIVYTGGSWEFVGRGPIALTGSAMLSMMCDAGSDAIGVSFGLETAPLYVQRTFAKQTVEQWITGTLGFVMGNTRFRYGVIGSVGLGYVGAGVRTLWMPWQTRKGVGRGFELRTLAWVSDRVGFQASLQFHLTAHRRSMRTRGKK